MNTQIIPQEELEQLTIKEIFTQIWFQPRQVFRFIHKTKYDNFAKTLLFLAGISRAFDKAVNKELGDDYSLGMILLLCIVFGGFFGWLSYYIYAALISWGGKWLKGKSNTDAIFRMFAYAVIPLACSLLFLIPQIAIYGVELFKSDGDIYGAGLLSNILVYSSLIFEFVLAIWTMILCVVGLSEVQQFSIGKAILNLLIPVLLILVPILIIVSIL